MLGKTAKQCWRVKSAQTLVWTVGATLIYQISTPALSAMMSNQVHPCNILVIHLLGRYPSLPPTNIFLPPMNLFQLVVVTCLFLQIKSHRRKSHQPQKLGSKQKGNRMSQPNHQRKNHQNFLVQLGGKTRMMSRLYVLQLSIYISKIQSVTNCSAKTNK